MLPRNCALLSLRRFLRHLGGMKLGDALALLPIAISFIGCLVSAETAPSPGGPANTGIEGQALITPVRGGPIREGEPSSKPLPDTEFIIRQGGKEIAAFKTDADGRFRVALSPGDYEIFARNRPKIGSWGPFPAQVKAGEITTVSFTCHSGMY